MSAIRRTLLPMKPRATALIVTLSLIGCSSSSSVGQLRASGSNVACSFVEGGRSQCTVYTSLYTPAQVAQATAACNAETNVVFTGSCSTLSTTGSCGQTMDDGVDVIDYYYTDGTDAGAVAASDSAKCAEGGGAWMQPSR